MHRMLPLIVFFCNCLAILLIFIQQPIFAFTPGVTSVKGHGSTTNSNTSTKRNFIEEARKNVFEAVTGRLRVTTDGLKFNVPVPDLRVIKERRLRDYQKRGAPIASSFVPNEYSPHPLLRNQHLQTILGVFVRDFPGIAYVEKSNALQELLPVGKAVLESLPEISGVRSKESECDYWDKREKFNTPDGDFFHVDYKFQDIDIEGGGEGMVVIIHGLESNSNSSLCQNMARAYQEINMDVACINFRGCCGNPNDTVYQYHAGFTDDVMVFLDQWAKRNKEQRPLYITGFSLGANVALKLLGDLSMDAVDKYNIRGAAVSGAPFSLHHHWRQLIDYDFHRIVYAGSVLKSMKKKVQYITDRFFDGDTNHGLFDYSKCMNAKTISEIEDAMIAPLYGFQDRFEYYDKSASLPVIDRIAVPTFVLNAKDDPFFNPDHFPWEKDCEIGGLAPIKLVRTENGGHLGHLFHCIDSGISKPVSSFAPMELARFLSHVQRNMK